MPGSKAVLIIVISKFCIFKKLYNLLGTIFQEFLTC